MINYQEDLERYQEEIEQLASEKRYAELRDLFLPMEPADIALLLEEGRQELMMIPESSPSTVRERNTKRVRQRRHKEWERLRL